MSPREQLQHEITEWLREHDFNAPYGVIEGMQTFGKGKARNITFGVPRYLDAHLIIVGANMLLLNESTGGDNEFHSVDELYEHLKRWCD